MSDLGRDEMIVLAQAATPLWSVFAQYGVLGVAVLVLGKFAFDSYSHERARADRLEALNQHLYEFITSEIVPLTTRAVIALERLADHVDGVEQAPEPKPKRR